jgi:hypothetical protein
MKTFMRWLEKLIIRWDLRSTPRHELQEMYILLIMAARRCSYDMNHCAQDVSLGLRHTGRSDEEVREQALFWHDRSNYWQDVFEVDSGKKYRHELHHKIWNLEDEIGKYEKILEAAGIKDPIKGDKIPF